MEVPGLCCDGVGASGRAVSTHGLYTLPYEVLVEDDNGRYFVIIVVAVDKQDARKRVAYILEPTSARIVRPRDTER